MDEKGSVEQLECSSSDLFDQFWICMKPFHQVAALHKHGLYDDCGAKLSDWGKCLSLNIQTNEIKKKVQDLNRT